MCIRDSQLPLKTVYYLKDSPLKPGRKIKYDQQQVQKVKHLYKNGVSAKEIANNLKIPLRTVYFLLKRWQNMDPNLILIYQKILLTSGICGLVAFFVTFLSMPRLIKKLKAAEIVGKDIHKPSKPLIAEMGGIGILSLIHI